MIAPHGESGRLKHLWQDAEVGAAIRTLVEEYPAVIVRKQAGGALTVEIQERATRWGKALAIAGAATGVAALLAMGFLLGSFMCAGAGQ